MRTLIGILYLSITHSLWAQISTPDLKFYERKDWSSLSREQVKHYNFLKTVERKQYVNNNIVLAKHAILNGNLEQAKIFLDRIKDNDKRFQQIKKRYLSIIAFINKDYNKSLDYISNDKFTEHYQYKQICLLRLINYLTLKRSVDYGKELKYCYSSIENHSEHGLFWLQQMSLLAINKNKILQNNYLSTISNFSSSNEDMIMWLKIALFLNKESEIIKALPKLSYEMYQSKKIRELIAFAYYRTGDKKMAEEFIEDIESPNADNIRGNINLEKGRYELAFGHFQLALKKKRNSMNALYPSVPLAWRLGHWEQADRLLTKIHEDQIGTRKKLALMAAIKIRAEKFDNANRIIRTLENDFKSKTPIEVDLMNSYVNLRKHRQAKLKITTDHACKKYDGLNCYLQMQSLAWDNLGETIERKGSPFSLKNFDIEKLKEKVEIVGMKEARYIDQKDIEELDSWNVKLVP